MNVFTENVNRSDLSDFEYANVMQFVMSTSLPLVPYSKLALETDNWKEENLLGVGGFSNVYKGAAWNNIEVAIKKFKPRNYKDFYSQLKEPFREIKILDSLKHENILSLFAYSIDGEAPCLLYQRMSNGSLEDRLLLKGGSLPLSWRQRYNIAKGTARGLKYLHTIHSRPLIHGDIKSANILLDKNFEPKIGDFGLARETSSNNFLKLNNTYGTKGYMAEDFIREKILSTKVDTYSFGIVLFELATGLPFDKSTIGLNKYLKKYINSLTPENADLVKDSTAGDEFDIFFLFFMLLSHECTEELAENRPEMTAIYEQFRY